MTKPKIPTGWGTGNVSSRMRAKYECRYCGGSFNSINAYEDHLLAYTSQGKPYTGSDGKLRGRYLVKSDLVHPVCVGERDWKSVIDPEVAASRLRRGEQMRKVLALKESRDD